MKKILVKNCRYCPHRTMTNPETRNQPWECEETGMPIPNKWFSIQEWDEENILDDCPLEDA